MYLSRIISIVDMSSPSSSHSRCSRPPPRNLCSTLSPAASFAAPPPPSLYSNAIPPFLDSARVAFPPPPYRACSSASSNASSSSSLLREGQDIRVLLAQPPAARGPPRRADGPRPVRHSGRAAARALVLTPGSSPLLVAPVLVIDSWELDHFAERKKLARDAGVEGFFHVVGRLTWPPRASRCPRSHTSKPLSPPGRRASQRFTVRCTDICAICVVVEVLSYRARDAPRRCVARVRTAYSL